MQTLQKLNPHMPSYVNIAPFFVALNNTEEQEIILILYIKEGKWSLKRMKHLNQSKLNILAEVLGDYDGKKTAVIRNTKPILPNNPMLKFSDS